MLDNALDLMDPALDLERYRTLLCRLHAFHHAAEHSLARWLPPELLVGRSKLAALRHDLARTGLPGPTIDELPAMPDRPEAGNRAAAFGLFYVVEGSTLGGTVIAKRLRDNANIPQAAITYFEIYGAETGSRWKAACAALEAASNPATDGQATAMAEGHLPQAPCVASSLRQ